MAQRIILADSDEKSLQTLTKIFQGNGYEVLSAEDGKNALKAINVSQVPHLILLNAALTEVPTPEICKHVRNDSRIKDVPIVIMSNENIDPIYRSFSKIESVTLPINKEELLKKVELIIKYGSSTYTPPKSYSGILKMVGIGVFIILFLAFLFSIIILPLLQGSSSREESESETF